MGLMGVSASISIGGSPVFLIPEGLYGGIGIQGSEFPYVAPKAGTISRIKGKIQLNSLDDTTTITLRVNGADTALTVTIPAGDASDFDIPGSLAVALGDLISWKVERPSTIGSFLRMRITYDFD